MNIEMIKARSGMIIIAMVMLVIVSLFNIGLISTFYEVSINSKCVTVRIIPMGSIKNGPRKFGVLQYYREDEYLARIAIINKTGKNVIVSIKKDNKITRFECKPDAFDCLDTVEFNGSSMKGPFDIAIISKESREEATVKVEAIRKIFVPGMYGRFVV